MRGGRWGTGGRWREGSRRIMGWRWVGSDEGGVGCTGEGGGNRVWKMLEGGR